MAKIFPPQQQNQSVKFRNKLIDPILLNVITTRVYEKDFEGTKKYILIAKKHAKKRNDFYFKVNLNYMENLLNYLTTGEYRYLQQIQEYIHLLKNIGDTNVAQVIEKEIKLVVHSILDDSSKNNLPSLLLRE